MLNEWRLPLSCSSHETTTGTVGEAASGCLRQLFRYYSHVPASPYFGVASLNLHSSANSLSSIVITHFDHDPPIHSIKVYVQSCPDLSLSMW